MKLPIVASPPIRERGDFTAIDLDERCPDAMSSKLDGLIAAVVIATGGLEIVSVITRASAEHLGLREGDEVTAIVKSTEVMINK